MRTIDWKKYVFAFAITAVIFFTAMSVSSYLNERRIAEIRAIEEKISVDILSLETQFDLLQESSCRDISEDSILSQELNELARRLSFTEGQLGSNNPEVLNLKRSYSLLQIKDYLLMKEITQKCELSPVFILYFYSNEGDCDDCVREGHVLTSLSEQYPQLRVYSFDYNLDLSAIQTLISIHKVENALPALVIDGTVHYGFQSTESIAEILPALSELEETATTTTDQ